MDKRNASNTSNMFKTTIKFNPEDQDLTNIKNIEQPKILITTK